MTNSNGGSAVEEVVKHKLNINRTYECLKRIKENLENCKAGEYSYDRAFMNVLELASVALEHIQEEL